MAKINAIELPDLMPLDQLDFYADRGAFIAYKNGRTDISGFFDNASFQDVQDGSPEHVHAVHDRAQIIGLALVRGELNPDDAIHYIDNDIEYLKSFADRVSDHDESVARVRRTVNLCAAFANACAADEQELPSLEDEVNPTTWLTDFVRDLGALSRGALREPFARTARIQTYYLGGRTDQPEAVIFRPDNGPARMVMGDRAIELGAVQQVVAGNALSKAETSVRTPRVSLGELQQKYFSGVTIEPGAYDRRPEGFGDITTELLETIHASIRAELGYKAAVSFTRMVANLPEASADQLFWGLDRLEYAWWDYLSFNPPPYEATRETDPLRYTKPFLKNHWADLNQDMMRNVLVHDRLQAEEAGVPQQALF